MEIKFPVFTIVDGKQLKCDGLQEAVKSFTLDSDSCFLLFTSKSMARIFLDEEEVKSREPFEVKEPLLLSGLLLLAAQRGVSHVAFDVSDKKTEKHPIGEVLRKLVESTQGITLQQEDNTEEGKEDSL